MRPLVPKILSILLLSVPVWGQNDHGPTELPRCPVTNEPVNFRVNTTTDDGPVYFCCKTCAVKFEKAPEKFSEATKAQHAALEQYERIQVNCPVTGNPINKKVFTEVKDKRVYFCCKGCKIKFEGKRDKYATALKSSHTYQTRCPVMGGKINPAVFTDLPTGERIYYCCPGCDKKLFATPEKYASKLEAQGTPIDVAKLKTAMWQSKE